TRVLQRSPWPARPVFFGSFARAAGERRASSSSTPPLLRPRLRRAGRGAGPTFSAPPASGSPPKKTARHAEERRGVPLFANEPEKPGLEASKAGPDGHDTPQANAPDNPRLRSPTRPVPPPAAPRRSDGLRRRARREGAACPDRPHRPRALRGALPERPPPGDRRTRHRGGRTARNRHHRGADGVSGGHHGLRVGRGAGAQPPLGRSDPITGRYRDDGEADDRRSRPRHPGGRPRHRNQGLAALALDALARDDASRGVTGVSA